MNTKTNFRKKSDRRRGTAIVEMALVVTILLVLTLGLIQWGMILNTSISITNLSREGARLAAVNPTDIAITTYVRDNAPPGIDPDDLTIVVTPEEGSRSPRQAVNVTIEYDMEKKIFLPTGAFGVHFFNDVYRATGTMMVEG